MDLFLYALYRPKSIFYSVPLISPGFLYVTYLLPLLKFSLLFNWRYLFESYSLANWVCIFLSISLSLFIFYFISLAVYRYKSLLSICFLIDSFSLFEFLTEEKTLCVPINGDLGYCWIILYLLVD